MLVLIDESGCSGFKFGRGSSSHFVVGMAIFNDFATAEKTSAAIEEAKRALRVKPEFRFSNCSDKVRDGFFRSVVPYNFRVRAIVIEKARIHSSYLRSMPDSFYNFFVQLLMKHDSGTLNGASVKIDGSGDREFKRALQVYLRQQIGPGKITKFRFVDSKQDNLIQLADMVTGAIARSYTNRANARHWRQMIAEKVDDVWEFE